ncbi:MAG TPA: polysaccharide biosynthesis/export family protein [Gemmataceae bacterium]|nr:polysaccharide biosynthesis/export family protein [Gemmataceae bacterium]
MPGCASPKFLAMIAAALGMGIALSGCSTCGPRGCSGVPPIPHELQKVTLPPYRIEPPDLLVLDALSVVPKPPYHIAPLDVLYVQASNLLPGRPIETAPPEAGQIASMFPVTPEGNIMFGPPYGQVTVAAMTLEQATAAVEAHLKKIVKTPKDVTVNLAQSRAMQQIRGDHLVIQDGTVNLGLYGSVMVAGMTVAEARAAIEKHLSQWLLNPEISVSVAGYNSKVYYIAFDNGGYGITTTRLPLQGGETVIDALSLVGGLPAQASEKHIWLARPAPEGLGCDQLLPIDYPAIVARADTATNYQLLPGDRIYVQADTLVTTNNILNKIISPIERIFGVTLLGTETVHSLRSSTGTGLGF